MTPDPFLKTKMHQYAGTASLATSNLREREREEDRYQKALRESIRALVDETIAKADGMPQVFPVRRAELEQRILASLEMPELGRHIKRAVVIFKSEGARYLNKVENVQLLQSLNVLSQRLKSFDLKHFNESTLKNVLSLSAHVKSAILKISIAKYSEGLLPDSLSILAFLTAVEVENPTYWYRLGIVAQQIEAYELALRAYLATSCLAPTFIGAHLFAGQCYLMLGKRNDALVELETAKYISKTEPLRSVWIECLSAFESLLKAA